MYTISIRTDFNAAHRLRKYKGKCESLHGHNWVVEVEAGGDTLLESGMLLDFTDLKKETARVLEKLDHKYLNEIKDFEINNPTSENIVKYIFDKIKKKYRQVTKVTVWETPTSRASYTDIK